MYRQRFFKPGSNKYGAKRCAYNGRTYDSKFEASVAEDLDWKLSIGAIKAWEPQYKVEMWACDHDGQPVFKKTHKIDFRVENLDGTYTLLEAKGFETADYKDRRKWLEKLWLPLHPDHSYEVVKQRPRMRLSRAI